MSLADKTEKKLIMMAIGGPPKTAREVNDTRLVMAQGNYPLGISDCYVVGIAGGCGSECPVFQSGQCEIVEEGLDDGAFTRGECIEIGYDLREKEA